MPTDTSLAERSSTANVSPVGSLVSILIPCCGMREYTKLLLPSLLKHTRPPFELLFLDVGSLDGTAEYLEGLAAGLPNVRIEIVRAALDLDIPTATREALTKARGDYIALLNNDTVVTNGWLNQLLGLVNMSPAIGMVGPMSNYAAPPQHVESIPYRISPRNSGPGVKSAPQSELLDIAVVERFASEFRETNKGKWLETERLGGFCLLLKRDVIRRATNQGQLDKWTDLSLFDTDILSSKAREAGFTLAVCRDLFIHHFGTRTFAHGAPAKSDR
jgi:GT2 family glycosyltransferase